jgi:hypothetical protein
MFLGRCMDIKSGAFCAYVRDYVCTPCPLGALCPGDAYVLPTTGYWSSGFPTDPSVERCPPPSNIRCPGINATVPLSARLCGDGYQGRFCSRCSKGYYTRFDDSTGHTICVPCKKEQRTIPHKAIAYFIVTLLVFACVITLASWCMSRRYGGSTAGSIKRSGKFILFVFLCAQYLVQVGKATKSVSGAGPPFRRLLNWLKAFQFSGLSTPAECLNATPFSTERLQMLLMLGILCCSFLLTVAWMGVSALSQRFGWSTAMRQCGVPCIRK